MDPDERTVVLDTESWLTASGLLSDIDPEPLGVSGNYVAFAYFGDKAPARPDDINIDLQPEQRHINLPTRGVFAEAHLSHCPAREQRDPTRMYGPDEIILPKAPDITGVQPGSRNVTPDLTPTPLPAPVVSIQNPPAAPDPAGLAAAFSLLGQMGPFRDMSTATEVGSLVGGLASGAISGNAVQPAAQRIAQALSSGGGAGGGGAFSSNHPAVSGTARDISDRLNLLQGTDLPEDTKAAIAQNLLDPGPANQTIDAGFIGSTEEVASHLSDWIAALLDPSDPKPQMHVEDTPLRRMTKKFSADLGGGNIAPDLGELVKVQRHRIEFNAPGKTLDDIETALADFANLVQYTQLSCNRLAGSGKIALGDRFRFRVFAGEWANAAATAIQASNLGSSRIVQFATSVLQIANSVGRRFDVEIIAYTKGGDFLQFAVQTLNTHPYAGRRSWIIRDLGGNKFRGETAEFNGWAWLVDGKVEASLGQNHLTDFSGLTWENFWPKLVNVLGGAITNQSGLIFPPKVIAPFANLQSSPLVQEILAEHPALQEEANRFTV